MRYFIALVVSLFLSIPMAYAGNTDIVEGIVKDTFSVVKNDLQTATTQPDARKIIDDHLLGMLDLRITAQIVLGKNWAWASPKQRDNFISEFRDLMIRSYSAFLLGEDAKTVNMDIIGSMERGNNKVLVKTTIVLASGQKFPVNYLFRYNTKKEKWLVIDVTVDGVSVALSFRTSYQEMINNNGGMNHERNGGGPGLDFLISSMKTKNESVVRK